MQIGIGISAAEMKAMRDALNPQHYRQAMWQATKRSTRKVRVMAGDVVRSRLTIRKKFIDAPNSDTAAIQSRLVTREPPIGNVTVVSKRIPLSEFSYKASKRGVTVTYDKQRPPLTLRHAFKATVASSVQSNQGVSHVGIWTRKNMMITIAAWTRTQPLSRRIAAAAGDESALAGLSKHKLVAAMGRYGPNGYAWRTPMVEEHGLAVVSFVSKAEILDPLIKSAGSLYRDELSNQIARFTGGRIKSLSTLMLETGDTDQ